MPKLMTWCLLLHRTKKSSFVILLIGLLGLITVNPQQNHCSAYYDVWDWNLNDRTERWAMSCSFIQMGTCGTGTGTAYQVICGSISEDENDLYIVCHDHSNDNTLYSLNVLRHLEDKNYPEIRDSDLQGWRTGPKPFYKSQTNSLVNNCYTKKEQVENFKRILNLEDVSKYVSYGSSFLAKGHLSADADMTSLERQRSSYYYINSAPQWQNINNGNWKRLEKAVRDRMLQKNKNPFIVFTGTYGTLTLPDVNNMAKEIYMIFDGNNNGYIPVPKYFWKIVWEEKVHQAIAFIVINNPYLENLNITPESLVFCKDVCDYMPWFTTTTVYQNRKNIEKGYIFCCTVKELIAQLQYYGVDPPLLKSSLLL